jgi:hypothetical protein
MRLTATSPRRINPAAAAKKADNMEKIGRQRRID